MLGIISAVVSLLLFISAAYFLVLPFIYNEIEYKERVLFAQIDETDFKITNAIEIKSGRQGYFIDEQRKLEMKTEIQNLIKEKIDLTQKVESLITSVWWKKTLPTKYQIYEEQKTDAIKYLKSGNEYLSKVKDIEYEVQTLIFNLDDYSKKIKWTEGEPWEVYYPRAVMAKENGDNIATISAEMVKRGSFTNKFNDYVQIQVRGMNGLFDLLTDQEALSNKTIFTKRLAEITKVKVPDVYEALEDLMSTIVTPMKKKEDSELGKYFEKMEKAINYYNENDLNLDLLARIIRTDHNINAE